MIEAWRIIAMPLPEIDQQKQVEHGKLIQMCRIHTHVTQKSESTLKICNLKYHLDLE